jgi:hypothetical protein
MAAVGTTSSIVARARFAMTAVAALSSHASVHHMQAHTAMHNLNGSGQLRSFML